MKTHVVKKIAALSKRYEEEVLKQWQPRKNDYLADWFEALDFLLAHIYFQGRRDQLSERYYKAAKSALDEYFGSDPMHRQRRFLEAWESRWIPNDEGLRKFDIERSPLSRALIEHHAGKGRDQEMVLDVLRYIHKLTDWNVVRHSLDQVRDGKILQHQKELMLIRQIGPKTSAFYLRDICALYNLSTSSSDAATTQPIDTWVRQVSELIGIIDKTDNNIIVVEKIGRACYEAGVSGDEYNSGAWYLGTHSLRLALNFMDDQTN